MAKVDKIEALTFCVYEELLFRSEVKKQNVIIRSLSVTVLSEMSSSFYILTS
jgi:hypothetical protein